MVREKRSSSQSMVGGPDSQFKRLRDQNSSDDMTQALPDQNMAHPSWCQVRWACDSAAEALGYSKDDSEPPRYKPEMMPHFGNGGHPQAPSQRIFPESTLASPVPTLAGSMIVDAAPHSLNYSPFGSVVQPGNEPDLTSNNQPGWHWGGIKRRASSDLESLDSRTLPSRIKAQITHGRGFIKIGHVDALQDFFKNRLSAILVNPCKPVAAKLVEALCPGKKHEYPYFNRTKPELFNGKPSWWPENITYQSPHHMRKAELLQFLCHLLTLPLTNQPELQEIIRGGQFRSWAEILNSTFTDLNLRDSKHSLDANPGDYDEQRHYARIEVLHDVYRISDFAARCAEGEYDGDFAVEYQVIPDVCFKERKKIMPTNSDEEVNEPSLNARENSSFEEGAEGPNMHSVPRPSSYEQQGYTRFRPNYEIPSSPRVETQSKMEGHTATPRTRKFLEAARMANENERMQHQPRYDQDVQLGTGLPGQSEARIQERENTFPSAPEVLRSQQDNQQHWPKPEDSMPAKKQPIVQESNWQGTCVWPNAYRAADNHRSPEMHVHERRCEPVYYPPMSTHNAGYPLSPRVSVPCSVAPVQTSQYYPLTSGQQITPSPTLSQQSNGQSLPMHYNVPSDPRHDMVSPSWPEPLGSRISSGRTGHFLYERGRA